MHERSLVKSLIEQVCDEVRLRKLGRIHAVRLELGEFSGVEPKLVELAFAELAGACWDFPVRLDVTVVPLLARCADCGTSFRVESFRFVCPVCGKTRVDIVDGDQVRLVSLDAERTAKEEVVIP